MVPFCRLETRGGVCTIKKQLVHVGIILHIRYICANLLVGFGFFPCQEKG